MEIALAPITGTRLLAPFRLSVVSTLANLMIEANRFETIMAPAPAGPSPNVAHPSEPTRREGVEKPCVEVRSGTFAAKYRRSGASRAAKFEPTRKAEMAAFAKSWLQESASGELTARKP